jgi:hypothetical protein
MVGMGVGTLATFAHDGDHIRIYEINPEVRRFAETYFTFLRDSPAQIEVVMGDARLSLEREAPQDFDLLFLDAFSGDAIPLHLLTREAFEIYLRHLNPDGVLVLLISTWHLDLGPVVRTLAKDFGFDAVRIVTGAGPWADWGADWMLVTRNQEFLQTEPISYFVQGDAVNTEHQPLWTDDYASLFHLLWR